MRQFFASRDKSMGFSFGINPCNEYSGMISFRMDCFDLLAVQGTLKSLLQHYCLKASILQCSAFFTAQLSHPYVTSEKTIALTRQIFVGKVMSLLFNMLSRFVIAFLPRSKHFSFHGCSHHLQWFWSPQNKVWHCFHCFPIYFHSVLLTTPKPLTVWITINCEKFWERWECQTIWPASWEICMQVKKHQLELAWNNRLVSNSERSTSKLYIVTLLI